MKFLKVLGKCLAGLILIATIALANNPTIQTYIIINWINFLIKKIHLNLVCFLCKCHLNLQKQG